MKYTEPIEFKGLGDLKEYGTLYRDKFIKDSIIVFRNAHLSHDDHLTAQKILGDFIGWWPNNTGGIESRYTENHKPNAIRTPDEDNKDVVILPWHVEHPFFTNPIVAGLWNMYKFRIPSDRGKTYFIDTRIIYNLMSEDWKEFLNKCVANAYSWNHTQSFHPCKVVVPHWITGEPTIRLQLQDARRGFHDLVKFDDREPTEEEQDKFLKIYQWIIDEIWNNEKYRIVHKWQEGDLVIPDLHCLAHAITGGFSHEDREFTGLWSYQKDNNIYPWY